MGNRIPSPFSFQKYTDMIKTYKANTNVSINVVLESKKNLHVTFVPLSDGSSRFTTDNEDVQRGIESHYKFGKLFRLLEVEPEVKKKKLVRVAANAKEHKDAPVSTDTNKSQELTDEINPEAIEDNAPSTTEEADNVTETSAEETAEETVEYVEVEDDGEGEETDEQEAKVVKVSDLAAAKDYLADTFGISRTTLRSKKAIVASGEANGIVFEGLD